MLVYMLRLILVVLNDKNCIFRHKFYKKFSKSQFYENADENSIYVSFVFHLTISTLRHIYSFTYDMFNWYDGIRYSYISFCAKSASISLVDFSMDIVVWKKSFRQKLNVELKFISAIFTFDKNMKSCIFAHSGIISLIYLFVCMYISYKAHNRWTKETFLIGSDVDVNMFSALRSIPSGTIDIILRRCIWTVTNCDTIVANCDLSQFVIKAVKWHIDSNNTENVLGVLGRVPMFTFDMNMKSFIFADSGVISLVHLFVCISVIKPIIDVQRKTSWYGSDVDVNIFSALRSIPYGTIDIILKSCIMNRHKLRQSQIATLSSQFVICRNLWSWPWRGILIQITL